MLRPTFTQQHPQPSDILSSVARPSDISAQAPVGGGSEVRNFDSEGLLVAAYYSVSDTHLHGPLLPVVAIDQHDAEDTQIHIVALAAPVLAVCKLAATYPNITAVEEGWWEGVLNGKSGMFPSNFIKELPNEQEETAITQEDTTSKTCVKDQESPEQDAPNGIGVKLASDGSNSATAVEIQPKKIKGFGFGDIFKDKPIKLRPRSMEIELENSTINKVLFGAGLCILAYRKIDKQ
ncbi:hypothetical protein scyTo_0005902 [Scyliorhinus torazame]|uniref:SH3 domain-containing protein n=1 Tax=Scyliorhinus torazame TaxID=75743 RepID=A0A401PDV9_SCYTO|nr:hypothetical protein [Scyliorhinus torazame]